MTQKSIDEAVLAQLRLDHRLWLQLPATKTFFAALLARKQTLQDEASKKAAIVQVGNAEEHNKNVRAREVLHIIETYANPNTYPDDYPTPSAEPAAVPAFLPGSRR